MKKKTYTTNWNNPNNDIGYYNITHITNGTTNENIYLTNWSTVPLSVKNVQIMKWSHWDFDEHPYADIRID